MLSAHTLCCTDLQQAFRQMLYFYPRPHMEGDDPDTACAHTAPEIACRSLDTQSCISAQAVRPPRRMLA